MEISNTWVEFHKRRARELRIRWLKIWALYLGTYLFGFVCGIIAIVLTQ